MLHPVVDRVNVVVVLGRIVLPQQDVASHERSYRHLCPQQLELIKSLKLGNVRFFVQLIFGPRWPMNQLNKNPNIAELATSHQLCQTPT